MPCDTNRKRAKKTGARQRKATVIPTMKRRFFVVFSVKNNYFTKKKLTNKRK